MKTTFNEIIEAETNFQINFKGESAATIVAKAYGEDTYLQWEEIVGNDGSGEFWVEELSDEENMMLIGAAKRVVQIIIAANGKRNGAFAVRQKEAKSIKAPVVKAYGYCRYETMQDWMKDAISWRDLSEIKGGRTRYEYWIDEGFRFVRGGLKDLYEYLVERGQN